MNTMTIVLLCVIVALACSLAWLGILLRREKIMRRDAESGEEFWINVLKEQHGLLKEAVKETQSMICQSTESLSEQLTKLNAGCVARDGAVASDFRTILGGVEAIGKKLDEISAGGMDAEARRTLEADLGKLLSYSMDDAFRAAKGIGSDAE